MMWNKIANEKPKKDEMILVAWLNIHNDMVMAVSSRREVSRHGGKNPPLDDRYWIFGSRAEIKPIYWMPLPHPPKNERLKDE